MTNWTDLIDTDPVGAAKLWLEGPIEDTADRVLPTENLVSNLAALCEALSEQMASEGEQLKLAALGVRTDTMSGMRNPDGSRRFPKVGRKLFA